MNEKAGEGVGARLVVLELLHQCLDRKQSFDLLLDQHEGFRTLSPQDRGFVHMLVATTMRRYGQCDDLIEKLQDNQKQNMQPMLRHILRIGLVQIIWMEVADHAAVATSVDLCEQNNLTKAKGFVNALLRRFLREKSELLDKQDPVRLNIPKWLLDPLISDWGLSGTAEISTALLGEAPIDITIKNPGMLAHWQKELNADHLFHNTLRLKQPCSIRTLLGYDDGHWWVQDAAAGLPVELMGDVKGKLVYDLCAAPGGKTAQLAAKTAKVVALDRSAKRLDRLKENMLRLSLGESVQVEVGDAAEWHPPDKADMILLDAPCSATGVIRRHPDILHLKSSADIQNLCKVQGRLLNHAATLLKSGGTLLYCTCSLLKSEGEDQIAKFLSSTKEFKRSPITVDELAGNAEFLNDNGEVRLFPHYLSEQGGIDGFFIARLQKK